MVNMVKLGAMLLGVVGGIAAAPTEIELGKRDISTAVLDELKFFSQYSAASYCPINNNSTNTKITCPGGNCPLIESANTTTLTEFENALASDVTGFVATDTTNELIVISFRGSSSVRNWLINFAFFTTSTYICSDCHASTGFWTAWLEAQNDVVAAVKAAHAEYPSYRIVATGHSLGGAIANLAAGALRNLGFKVDLFTYGAPKVGAEAFSDYLSQTVNGTTYRVTHENDPVPRLPPMALGFANLSPEYYITSGANVEVTATDVDVYTGYYNISGNDGNVWIDFDAHTWYFGPISSCPGDDIEF